MVWARGAAIVGLGLLAACGDNGTGPSEPQPRTETRTATIQPGGTLVIDVTPSRNETADATVNWNNGANDIDLFATVGPCAAIGPSCLIVARAESTTNRPERVTFSVAPANTYKIWILNFGTAADNVTLTVTFTPR